MPDFMLVEFDKAGHPREEWYTVPFSTQYTIRSVGIVVDVCITVLVVLLIVLLVITIAVVEVYVASVDI